jgi:hypothetical protein
MSVTKLPETVLEALGPEAAEDLYFKRLRFGLFQRTENSRITRFPIQLCVLDERFG